MRAVNIKIIKKWLLFFLAIFFVFIIIPMTIFIAFEKKYKNRFYPGVFLGDASLSGYTLDEAKEIINKKIDKINQDGIIFSYLNNYSTLYPLVSSIEGDLAYEIINYDVEKTLNKLFMAGRSGKFINKLQEKINLAQNKRHFKIIYAINDKEVLNFLTGAFSHLEQPTINAGLKFVPGNYISADSFTLNSEKLGQAINYKQAIKKLKNNLGVLNYEHIKLSSSIDYPKIFKKDALNYQEKINTLLDQSPFYLSYGTNEYHINKTQLAKWLALEKKSNSNEIIVVPGFSQIELYLDESIAPKINQEPINAKFEIKNGKVTEFQVSKDGVEIDTSNSYKKIIDELLNGEKKNYKKIELAVVETKSTIKTADINDMGINKIIGTGHSNFAGSPQNRRHNIAVGADAVNGTLLEPGKEFSLNNVLGEVDADSGYLPELVIKEGRTIPEYGGGLCQIGTTLFRGTLSTGLPITMRRNHSYRVSYYEPAGTDATIYSPWPDYKFVNDTAQHILIQSRIKGNDIYFDFWGTDDGRIATTTYPIIYNITRPGPTKIIETLDLKPGEKKCTEHAHNGADAYFDYTVAYSKNNPPQDIKNEDEITDEDLTKEKRFTSHYVPWREVCLLGVEKLSTDLSTSSEEIIE